MIDPRQMFYQATKLSQNFAVVQITIHLAGYLVPELQQG